MKVIAILFVAFLLFIDPSKVSQVNKLKSEAKTAYLAGDMKTAIAKYTFLVDSLQVDEDEVEMNLANAYFNLNDTSNAVNRYQPLSASGNSKINSQANQQMGVMANRQGKFEEALNHFKQAMKAEPNNEQARYNYEMVKKKLEEKKKQEQQNKDKNNQDKKDDQKKDQKDQQNKDQKDKQDQKDKKDQQNKDKKDEKKDQKDKEQKDKEQKEKEQQKKDQQDKKDEKKEKPDPSLSDKLKDMKISEEKAKMILEAMKNQEVQYLQQNKRKATRPKDKGKPDW